MSSASGFLNTLTCRSSEREFTNWLAAHGEPTFLQDEMLQTGQAEFVPYVNADCESPNCVYDLKNLEDLYAENGYSLSDAFERAASMLCTYCDRKLFFVSFFTSQKLADIVDHLFEQHLHQQREKEMRALEQRRQSITKQERGRQLRPQGSMESYKQVARETEKTHKKKLLIPVLSSEQRKPRSKNTFKILAVSLASQEVKEALRNKPVPSLDEFDENEVKSVMLKANQAFKNFSLKGNYLPFEPAEYTNFLFREELDIRPTFEQSMRSIGVHTSKPASIYQIILQYWRRRVCLDTNKFLNLWIVEVLGDAQNPANCQLKLREDPNLKIMTTWQSQDSEYFSVLFIMKSEIEMVEFNRRTSTCSILTHKEPVKTNKATPGQLETLFVQFCTQYLNQQLLTKQKGMAEVEMFPSTGTEISTYVLDRFYDEENVKSTQDPLLLESWITLRAGLVTYNSSSLEELQDVQDLKPQVAQTPDPVLHSAQNDTQRLQLPQSLMTIEEISIEPVPVKPKSRQIVTISELKQFSLPGLQSNSQQILKRKPSGPAHFLFQDIEPITQRAGRSPVNYRIRLPDADASPRTLRFKDQAKAETDFTLKPTLGLKSPILKSPSQNRSKLGPISAKQM